MPKLKASDTVVLGISADSPAANAAFAKQIGVTFPLLSDMSRTVMKTYGILQKVPSQKLASSLGVKGVPEVYEWAERTTFVIDKNGVIQHIDQGGGAVDPNTAVSACSRLQHGSGSK